MTDEEYQLHVAQCSERNVCPMCERPSEEHDLTESTEQHPNGTMRCRKAAVNPVSENYYAEMNDKTEVPIVNEIKEDFIGKGLPELVPEAVEEIARKTAIDAAVADFDQAFRDRSFSDRNVHLGKMIKCAECGKRHRAEVRHDFKTIKEANPKRFREPANPYWRPKPGRFAFIQSLKKFVSLKS